MICLPAYEIPEAGFFNLCSAISEKSCSRIYKELNRFTHTFSPEGACFILGEALQSGLPLKVFEAILDRSPPVPELFSDGNLDKFVPDAFGLIESAAFKDRADVLSLFLERGAGPNRNQHYAYSPLESALIGASPKSVRVLMRQRELDTAWTDELLLQWAIPGAARELCRRAMAPRFTGWKPGSSQPLPIPEPMTALIIANAGNWPLLERFCRERGPVPLEDGRSILQTLSTGALKVIAEGGVEGDDVVDLLVSLFETLEEEAEEKENVEEDAEADSSARAGALAALLESCPGLLRGERACRALLRCFFGLGEPARELLRPWVESMGRRRIAMPAEDWSCWEYGEFPKLWQKLLPQGPVLVLDRWTDLFDGFVQDGDSSDTDSTDMPFGTPELSESLSRMLSACPLRGKGRKGELSPLARTVLLCGGASLVDALFRQSGGLLATEDPNALIDFVLQSDCSRAIRATVLSYTRKEEKYAL